MEAEDKLTARDFINPSFMGLTSEEMRELDLEIERLQNETSYKMNHTEWRRNERPYQADVVEAVEGEDPRGGASQ